MNIPDSPLKTPLIYLISDRRAFPPPQNIESQLEAIEVAARSGCQLIQIRERDLEACELISLVRSAIALARPYQSLVLVNDRLDVALAADADGVHLRSTSLSVADARIVARLAGRKDLLIGASVHSMAEAKTAIEDNADFLVCGPVFDTASKQQYGAPLGLNEFGAIAATSRIPVLGIGGIDCENAQHVLAQGAAGVAGISLFSSIEAIEAHVRAILSLEFTSAIKYSSPVKEC